MVIGAGGESASEGCGSQKSAINSVGVFTCVQGVRVGCRGLDCDEVVELEAKGRREPPVFSLTLSIM